jgi:2-polyprenyl-3-methyl-5-hydroxy-6-metoxy-1,4-benzoquinol methylase
LYTIWELQVRKGERTMTKASADSRFDALAKEWDIAPQHVERTRDIAVLLRERIPIAGLSALEVGAGTGLLSFALSDWLGKVVATDPAQGMVDVIEDKIRQSVRKNLHALRCGDDLAEIQERFDLAMLQMSLHHILDVPAFLVRIHAKLVPGGYLAIADLDREDGSFHGPGTTGIHLGFDRIELMDQFVASGFEPVSMETAHVVKRRVEGAAREYPVFLAIARKAGE